MPQRHIPTQYFDDCIHQIRRPDLALARSFRSVFYAMVRVPAPGISIHGLPALLIPLSKSKCVQL